MRSLLRTFAALAVFPYLAGLYLLVTGSASWSSVGYAAAFGVLLGGLATLPAPQSAAGATTASEGAPASGAASGAMAHEGAVRRRRPRGLSRGAALTIALVALARVVLAGEGRALHVDRGGAAGALGGARIVNRLVDEGDVAVAGTRVLVASGMLRDDTRELPGAMGSAYGAMRKDEGDAPSPFAATYLGLEEPSSFDLVLIAPEASAAIARGAAPPRTAVVFLHGFAGGFDLPCWQIARAVASLDVLTACPSTRWVGDWWSRDGEATLRRTVDLLHARGVERIILAGLSNGGFGASRLAPRMKGTFAGLVLISGAERSAPSAGVPTLVIHGRHDTMTSCDESRAYAASTGARFVELDAGHFAMLVRGERFERALREFVAERVDARAER